ncbi:MAG: hypothetical protein ACUVWJ_05325 [Spirochaetota bacterium]
MSRRVLIIAGVVIILIGSFYLLFEEYMYHYRSVESDKLNKLIPDMRVEGEFFKQVDTLSHWLVRRLEIENKKIDFLIKFFNPENFLKGDERTIRMFQNFQTSTPQCLKVQLVSGGLTILRSTGNKDVPGMVLNRDVYRDIFSQTPTHSHRVIFDPVNGNIVFFRAYNRTSALLFYYSGGFLESIFKNAYGNEYKGFSILAPSVIVINCPEYGEDDEEKINNLRSVMSSEVRGVEKIRLGGRMRYVYFSSLSKEPYDLSLGVVFDRKPFHLSVFVLSIFVLQLMAILSLTMFFVQRGKGMHPKVKEVLAGSEAWSGSAQPGESTLEEKPKLSENVLTAGAAHPARTAHYPEGGAVKTGRLSEIGFVPLDDVEEVLRIDELGEAEVTLGDRNSIQTPLQEAPLHMDREVIEGLPEKFQKSGSALKETEEMKLPPVEEERIFDDLKEIRKSREGKPLDLPELESLIKAGAGHRKDLTVEERIQEVDSLIEHEEEKVITVGGILSRDSGILNSAEEGVLREGIDENSDEELFDLINAVEEQGTGPVRESDEKGLKVLFRKYMEEQGLSKGALLIRDKDRVYKPSVMVGLSDETFESLSFTGEERYFKNILLKGKILAINNPAVLRGEMRAKFSTEDLSSLRRIFFVPIQQKEGAVFMTEGRGVMKKGKSPGLDVWPGGIFVSCIPDYEDYEDKYLIKKLIKIIKIIKDIL